jgi:putative membrane protein insertion efficiency factor
MVRFLKKIAAKFLIVAIQALKNLFQIPHGCCRFYPSCSDYAAEAIETMSIGKAVPHIVKRVLKCHPFTRGGFDPVQETVIGRVDQRE